MKSILVSVVLGLVATSASNTEAAVSLVDSLAVTSTADGLSYTINASTLDFTGASKLVVTVGSEGTSANGAAPAPILSLSYGGVALSAAVATADPRSNIWYVDLAGKTFTGTDFQLEFATGGEAANRGYGFAAYALAGTADGVSATGQSNSDFTTLNPPTAGEFMIASFSRNNVALTTNPGGFTLLNNVVLEGQYSAVSAYGTLASSGSQTIELGLMNTSGRTVAATFAAIPEPSHAALLGLGGLALLLRRRK